MTVRANQVWIDTMAREGDESRVVVMSVSRITAARHRAYRFATGDAKEVMYCTESQYGKRRVSAELMLDHAFEERFVKA